MFNFFKNLFNPKPAKPVEAQAPYKVEAPKAEVVENQITDAVTVTEKVEAPKQAEPKKKYANRKPAGKKPAVQKADSSKPAKPKNPGAPKKTNNRPAKPKKV